jgi:hypothetical protein
VAANPLPSSLHAAAYELQLQSAVDPVLDRVQAQGKAKQGKRKRYFEVEGAADAGAAAGPVDAASALAVAAAAASSKDEEDAVWESASDSETEQGGLAWGDFTQI